MYSIGGYSFEKASVGVMTDVMFPLFPQNTTADVGVILGAGIASLALSWKAVEAVEKGQVGFLIFSGGAVVRDLPETAVFKKFFDGVYTKDQMPKPGETEKEWVERCLPEYLKKHGVPENRVQFEGASKNTKQNFQNLEKFPEYQQAGSVNLFGLLPTRALMTMRNTQSGKNKMAVLTDLFPFAGVDRENWQGNRDARELVFFEFSKIDPANPGNYIAKGDCADVNLKAEIQMAGKLCVPANGKSFGAGHHPGF